MHSDNEDGSVGRRPIGRRELLRGLAVAGGAALLAACGGAAPSTPETANNTAPSPTPEASVAAPPTATTAPSPIVLSTAAPQAEATPNPAAGQPRQGGAYRILASSDIPSLDAALAFDYIDWWASSMLVYNRLYSFDAGGKLFADLAAGMPEISSDRLTYTIPLRKGVKFHNGREVTATDVKFSLDRTADVKLASPGGSYNSNIVGYDEVAAGTATGLAGVKVLDPSTVQITLKQPQAVFPGVLAVGTNGIVPQDEVTKAGKDWGTATVIGTGPFKLSEWRTGEKLVFERNPDFFRTGAAYLDRVEIQVNVEASVSVLRWENGEAEYVYTVPAAELARIRSDPVLKDRMRIGPSLIFSYLEFRIAKPFDDVHVRQAASMAIDKQTLAERSQNGVALDGIYPSRLLQYDPAFKAKYAYNPEQAKRLLVDAGFADGVKGVKFWAGSSPNNNITGELIQADLKDAGIEAEIVTGDFALFKPRFESGEVQLAIRGFGSDYPDAASLVSNRLVCPATPPPPASQWCSKKVEALSLQTETLATDAPARTDLFRQLQELVINEEVALIPLYERNGVGLGQTYVHGDVIHPIFGLPVIEHVWTEQG